MSQASPHQGFRPRWPGERPFHGVNQASGSVDPGSLSTPRGAKKRAGCFQVGLVVLAVILGVTVLFGVMAVAEEAKKEANVEAVEPPEPFATEGLSQPSEAQPDVVEDSEIPEEVTDEEPSEPKFQGMKDSDEVTVPGEVLVSKRVGYMAAPLQQASTLGTRILCATVAIANKENSEESFGLFEWKLLDPNGVIRTPTLLDGGRPLLESVGELAPGGAVQGDVCFEGDSTSLPGEYVLYREEASLFSTSKLAWVNRL